MKIFVRLFGLSVLSYLSLLLMINLVAANIANKELAVVANAAMNETQLLMSEIMEDRLLGRHTARYLFTDDASYFAFYCQSLALLTAESQRYQVELISCDYEKGLLSVRVKRRVFKKTLTKTLLNIVEVCTDEISA